MSSWQLYLNVLESVLLNRNITINTCSGVVGQDHFNQMAFTLFCFCVGLYVIEYMPVPHVTILCTCILCLDDEIIMLKS